MKIKPLILTLALLGTLAFVPQTSAGSGFGISAFVELVQADPLMDYVEYRFNIQNTTSTYALWLNNTVTEFAISSPVTGEPDYQEGGGLGSFTLSFTGGFTNYQFFMVETTAGNATVQSCRITVDTTDESSQTACGGMESDWTENYCVPRNPSEGNSGFNYRHNVDILSDLDAFSFFRDTGEDDQSLAAITLNQGTRAERFYYTIEADTDTVESNFHMFFSNVTGTVGPTLAPDKDSLQPTTGAFATGYGLQLHEEVGGWDMILYHNVGGLRQIILDGAFSHSPNTPQNGFFEIDPWEGIITANMSTTQYVLDLDDNTPSQGDFTGFWLRENGGETVFDINAETFLYYDTSQNLCLYSNDGFPPTFDAGTGGELSNLPQFTGEGGYLSDPSFPGVNLNRTSTVLGIDLTVLGFIMAAVLVIVCVVGFGPIVGGGIGGAIAAGLATALGLIPAWLLVVLFLGLAALVVLGNRNGSGV